MTGLAARLEALAARRDGTDAGQGVGAIALERAQEEPERVIVQEGGRTLTRAELLDLALRLGGALRARGLERGAFIAFQLPNWWEACVINLAAALFDYRIVPLLPIYRQAELGMILPACGVEAIFVPHRFGRTDYPEMIAALESRPRHLFVVRGKGDPEDFESLLRSEPGVPDLPDAADAKLVIFTSGSTGRPKGVIHSHATMEALIRRAEAFWGLDDRDTLYVPSPIGHIGGSIYAFEFPWITGCRAILEERWDAERAVARIDAEGATFMAGATPFLSGLVEAAGRAGSDLPSLRRFVCGGASVPPELVHRALAAFPAAIVSRAYGSSEVPLVCPGARTRADAEARAETDGEVAVDLRLLDEAGQDATPGAEGEIAVRGPQMFAGYLDPEDDVGSFTDDGHFRMGDLGRLVDGRFLVVTGRKKDIIIRKGENISPLEIENALVRHEAVRLCAVIGLPDPERGELVAAFVVAEAGCSFGFAEMTAHLEQLGLARQKFPERLDVVDALPMNAVGKVQKAELKAQAAGAAALDGS